MTSSADRLVLLTDPKPVLVRSPDIDFLRPRHLALREGWPDL